MRIVEMRSENVKRLKAVHIRPDGSMFVVGGKNGAGKSSLLDSIFYALGGASSLPGKPVRKGAKEATIEVTIDSTPRMIVKRRITEDGKTTLEIKQVDENGKVTAKVSRPQDLLDSLYSKIAFDPLAFTRLKPQDQVDMLKSLAGVDVSDIDAESKRLFDERTTVNRDVKTLEAQVGAAAEYEGVPAEEVSMKDALAAVEEIRTHNAAVEHAHTIVERKESEHATAERLADEADGRVERLKEQLAEAEAAAKDAANERAEAANRLAEAQGAVMERRDDSDAVAAVEAVEGTNRRVRANKARAAIVSQLDAAKEQSADLTTQIEDLRQQRLDRMAKAKWPVAGLGFSEGGITYNDLPFSQSSSAEQLRVSAAIGLAENKSLKFMRVQDGSLLDEDGLAMLAELAEEMDAQVFVERVGNGAECSVILEDGSIVGADIPEGEPAELVVNT